MDTETAFAPLRCAFPSTAVFQGLHFRYAVRNGSLIVESRKFNPEKDCHVYFYWLLVGDHFVLIHASLKSKLAALRTIGDSLTPSSKYEP